METIFFVASLLLLALFSVLRTKRSYRLPPGPKGLPVIGNAMDVPSSRQWLIFQKWGREYDEDIITVNLFGTRILVLNSVKAVRDLCDKRSAMYSDREHTIMIDLVGWDRNFAFQPYGESWRESRRVFHQHWNSNAVKQYRPRSCREAKRLLNRLIAQPDDFMQELRTMAGSAILGITFGFEIQPHNDPYVVLAEKALHSMAMVTNSGSYVVDYLPFLRHLPAWAPGAQFKRDAIAWNKAVAAMYEKPWEIVKKSFAEGTLKPSIASTLLSGLDAHEDPERREGVIRCVAGTSYVAGSDTTVSSLGTFILAMTLHPGVQKAAQAEIDRVIGGDRLPSFEDLEEGSLPYITAIMLEVLRWRPVTPLVVPHKTTRHDEYKGYDIPAGTTIVGNAWAILHDERRYPNPDTFDPTRYLTAEGTLNKDAPSPLETAFGFSRRICPGRYFAMDAIWITAAYVLATLTIEKAVDEAGQVIEPSGEYMPGFLVYPLPFKAVFKPRSASALALIQAEAISFE